MRSNRSACPERKLRPMTERLLAGLDRDACREVYRGSRVTLLDGLIEVAGRQLRFEVESLPPATASFILLTLTLQGVAEVQKRFRKVWPLRNRFAIEADGVFQLSGLLK